ncbi:MAG TPA: cyclic nucleotide-binding domain-containing protein [Oligoflexus sp.]|uniref:cyclic nucleotide-binding domain-containing protein n=1 Tax=Oligoflexus sp. TaxID=1971216 RepID=UPI002D4B1C6D|nr:cyclic nucleotide-binding domain-containing protein [Oligoflexus sp.]HYX33755.1 cyclic nucleotide-binding domain-containing protein [Oligoflexus sp.]
MDELVSYKPGDIIFKQGDESKSMLMIKEGSVEVYKDTPQGEVILTVQNAGEVVGVLSFFSHGRRLATARARTHVEGQMIERRDGPADPLAKLPKWVQIVLKEFSQRLGQMNDQFARTYQEKNELMDHVLDPLLISTQMADCMAELGPFKAKKFPDGRDMIVLDDMLTLIQSCLGYEREQLTRVVDVFKNSGLMKVEIEQDHGKEVLALTGALRLKWYSEFVHTAKSGKTRRLVQSSIPFKQRRVLFGLCTYVQKSGGDITKNFSIDLADLAEKFEPLIKLPLDQTSIETAEKLGLLQLKRAGEKVTLTFQPTMLSRTLIVLNTIKRLRSDPNADFEAEDEKQAS